MRERARSLTKTTQLRPRLLRRADVRVSVDAGFAVGARSVASAPRLPAPHVVRVQARQHGEEAVNRRAFFTRATGAIGTIAAIAAIVADTREGLEADAALRRNLPP